MSRRTIDSKTRIYREALKLFIKKGIKGTSTREIAHKAGIAEGTIYKHFKSKDDLATKLFINYMTIFTNRLLESKNSQSDPKNQLESMIKTFFEFAKYEPKACFYIVIGHYTELNKISQKKLRFKEVL